MQFVIKLEPYSISQLNTVKVLLITRGIYPLLTGGIAVHVYYVSRALSKKFSVSILAERAGNCSSKISSFDKIPLVLTSVPSMPLISSLIFVLRGLFDCVRKVGRVDIVHAHQALTPAILAFLISRFYRIPFIITCHGSEIRTRRKRGLIKLIQRFLFSRASYLTTVSTEIKRILMNSYDVDATKISIIPNGYDERTVARLIKNMEREYPARIAFVGSLRQFKDPLTLLKGFREITEKYLDTELHIVGDGPLRERLRTFCLENSLSSKVIFEGIKPHEEALRAIAESTVFVLTSVEEGLPTVLIEVMALGKPVIATAVGGIPEVVKDGVNGILIPPKSPEHVAEALRRLLTDSELRRRLGDAARESVKDYTWSKIAEKYEIVYQKVLRPRS